MEWHLAKPRDNFTFSFTMLEQASAIWSTKSTTPFLWLYSSIKFGLKRCWVFGSYLFP